MEILKTIRKFFWLFTYAAVMTVVMLFCTIFEILRFGHPIIMIKKAAEIVYNYYEELREMLDEH